MRVFGERGHGDAALAGLRGAAFGGGDGHDVEALAHAADQGLDGEVGGGTGAQADHHAVLHQGGGGFRAARLAASRSLMRAPR